MRIKLPLVTAFVVPRQPFAGQRGRTRPGWLPLAAPTLPHATRRPFPTANNALIRELERVWGTLVLSTSLLVASFSPLPVPSISSAPPLIPTARLAVAAETGGMSCVASHCASQLASCLANPTCAKGLTCFIGCAAAGASEGGCQVRCTDLYENPLLDAFTACTLTEHQCYPALEEDVQFPPLPARLWDTASRQRAAMLLRGRWYVSAGLNPLFDAFDCQVHEFDEPTNQPEAEPVADAVFGYRVRDTSGGYLTRQGVKHLFWAPRTRYTGNLRFAPGKKWGRTSFVGSAPRQDTDLSRKKLVLHIDPNYMDYQDEWTILASHIDGSNTDYMVVAYRGTNAAWKGYGGLNVYTRRPVDWTGLLTSSAPQEQVMVHGIETGLAKVGLQAKDLIPVDNRCP